MQHRRTQRQRGVSDGGFESPTSPERPSSSAAVMWAFLAIPWPTISRMRVAFSSERPTYDANGCSTTAAGHYAQESGLL